MLRGNIQSARRAHKVDQMNKHVFFSVWIQIALSHPTLGLRDNTRSHNTAAGRTVGGCFWQFRKKEQLWSTTFRRKNSSERKSGTRSFFTTVSLGKIINLAATSELLMHKKTGIDLLVLILDDKFRFHMGKNHPAAQHNQLSCWLTRKIVLIPWWSFWMTRLFEKFHNVPSSNWTQPHSPSCCSSATILFRWLKHCSSWACNHFWRQSHLCRFEWQGRHFGWQRPTHWNDIFISFFWARRGSKQHTWHKVGFHRRRWSKDCLFTMPVDDSLVIWSTQ